MLLSLSDQMADVMADARSFSLENKIYYIDSLLVLLMLLHRDDVFLPIPEDDRAIILQRLSAQEWVQLETVSDLLAIPLTVELEELMDGAWRINKLIHSTKDLMAEDLLLAMLSVQGPCREKLERGGLIFEDYVEALAEKEGKEMEEDGEEDVDYYLFVPMDYAAREPQRDWMKEGMVRFLSGKSQKEKQAGEHLKTADYYYRFNQFKLCRNYCWYALQASPTFMDAYVLCAIAWMKERVYDKAYPHLKDALRLDPGNIYTMENMASCLRHMGAVEEAEKIYQQLPHDTDDVYLLNNLGFFYSDTGKYEQAISLLDRAIALGGDEYNAFAYNNKGYALMQLGQLDAAREFILKSLTLHKGNGYAYRNLALLYLKENNRIAAREALLQAKRFRFAALYGPEVDELLAGFD